MRSNPILKSICQAHRAAFRIKSPLMFIAVAWGSLLLPHNVSAQTLDDRYMDNKMIIRPMNPSELPPNPFTTTEGETLWVGYSPKSSDPNKVGLGGVWDFDTGIAGTDSSQFWRFLPIGWRSESTTALPFPADRPFWYFDNGNEVNIGDTNLWLNRDAEGRVYRRTGITSYWHVDDMTAVSFPIAGSSSAWCGLRVSGDTTVVDPVTNNYLTGDLSRHWAFGGQAINTSWPGYGNQIEQILYRDFSVSGDGTDTLSFRFRTDMSESPATENNGSAWFNPDPTDVANLILSGVPGRGPIDSLMVWVGLPQESNVYDQNKRWLSEVIDFTSATQPLKLFSQHGKAPLVGLDSTVIVNLPSLGGATTVRVAFQIKTNRQFSDATFDDNGFDSVDGAALLDDISVNGSQPSDFETADQIRPRLYLPGDGTAIENDPALYWIATGKPPRTFGHVHNAFDLPYDDPCGALGSPDRHCDLNNNIILFSSHDDPDHAHIRESWGGSESPTIDLSANSELTAAGVGGGPYNLMRLEYEIWTGTMDLDQSVFWYNNVRYWGPTFTQQADDLVPAWSDDIIPICLAFNPDPACVQFNSDVDFDGIVPPPSQLDSLRVGCWIQTRCARFGATVLCGKSEGSYFDNIRVGFTGGQGYAVKAQPWDLLQDTFPFNETISPGSAGFDTTTGLIKVGLNQAASFGGEGVIIGDTLSVTSPFQSPSGNTTRLDLIFRILPGPGNYSVAGDRSSSLIEKDPSHPFWTTYLGNNGPHGWPGGHSGGIWSEHVWNSARMDSADNGNIAPLIGRNLGIPVSSAWHGTLHESDPNYAALGIVRNLCFVVDPVGPINNINVCCSASECGGSPHFETWPPSAYLGAPTTTIEGTKILPDGYFSPGTHIEYFIRRSDAVGGMSDLGFAPDTNVVSFQGTLGRNCDSFRFLEVGVFPDLWKDQNYGGEGLACMFVVDAGDRRGQEPPILGALDTLGYGKNNGAGRGWKEVDPSNPNPDNPAGFVALNLGQKGLAFDWYDITAAESLEGGRPGCRLASPIPVDLVDRQCKQGPTPDMLKTYYNTILWFADDISEGVLHDGNDTQEQSNDVALLKDFLDTSGPGEERRVWIAGDGAAQDLASSMNEAPGLLANYFATTLISEDYRSASNNWVTPMVYKPVSNDFHPGRRYGMVNSCFLFPDVIAINGAESGVVEVARYEGATDRGLSINPGNYTSAVYRPADLISRYYSTLFTGHDLSHLRGSTAAGSETDAGRIAFIDDALQAFGLCTALGPVIAVGELPGASGAQLNFVRGAFPNPSIDGGANIQFQLARQAKVSIRIYDVAGRLIHDARVDGVAGNNTFRWQGQTRDGVRAGSGVYFYRLHSPDIEFRNNTQRLVLLGQGG